MFAHPTATAPHLPASAALMARWLRATLGHGAAAVAAALLLLAAGQPLFTDDAWWHLALGRAFAERGPWLPEDPLLFAAASPPSPSAWLFALMLHARPH